MDKAHLVHRRKKKAMAQILEAFEETVEPHIPGDKAEEFKGVIRQKLHALALDTCDIMALKPGEQANGHAVELRERLGDTRPHRRRTTA
jgi:hypothetical protein